MKEKKLHFNLTIFLLERRGKNLLEIFFFELFQLFKVKKNEKDIFDELWPNPIKSLNIVEIDKAPVVVPNQHFIVHS